MFAATAGGEAGLSLAALAARRAARALLDAAAPGEAAIAAPLAGRAAAPLAAASGGELRLAVGTIDPGTTTPGASGEALAAGATELFSPPLFPIIIMATMPTATSTPTDASTATNECLPAAAAAGAVSLPDAGMNSASVVGAWPVGV
jgi:hypothetical protein